MLGVLPGQQVPAKPASPQALKECLISDQWGMVSRSDGPFKIASLER